MFSNEPLYIWQKLVYNDFIRTIQTANKSAPTLSLSNRWLKVMLAFSFGRALCRMVSFRK